MGQNVPTGQDPWDAAIRILGRPSFLHLGGDRSNPAVQLCRYHSQMFVPFPDRDAQHDHSVSLDQRLEILGPASVE